MSNSKTLALRSDRESAASAVHELLALDAMSVGELAEKYRAVFGEPTRSRNKEYLRKRIAWRIQAHAEGGLSPYALERIVQLAPSAPARWRQETTRKDAIRQPTPVPAAARDQRLPPAGTVLSRIHGDTEHKVTVLAEGFEYCGKHCLWRRATTDPIAA